MGDAGPSSAGMDPEDMDGDDDMDETQALQIETAQPGGMPRRRGLLSKLLSRMLQAACLRPLKSASQPTK